MTTHHRSTLPAFALLLLLVCLPSSATVVFEIETTDLTSDEAQLGRIVVSGENMKMEMAREADGQRADTLFRGELQEMVIIDDGERSYFVLDKKVLGALSGQMSAAMKQMEAALAQLPKEQREMAERMMKQQLERASGASDTAPRTEYTKTGERETHNGYPCVKYVGRRGTETVLEMWVTDWSNLKGASEVEGVFRSLGEFATDLMESLQQMGGPMVGALAGGNPFDAFDNIAGFPVVTRSFSGGHPENETSLREVRNETIDPAEFEVPAGYRRQTMGAGR